MWRLRQIISEIWPKEALVSRRDRLSVQLAIVTVVCLGAAFILSKGTQFLMPGPLASAHGAIEACGTCHTKSGAGKLSWVHGLVAGDPLADSKACLTCHKMPDTAFNPHGASAEALKRSTERLIKIARRMQVPTSARAQNIAFPTDAVVARDLYCATCHQEHQGPNFNLSKISNEQCRSCHVVKFDSFDGHHPKFESYPFKRRTRIIYDHAGHFGKHYPEVAKKDPAKRIPDTCSTCHNSRDDKRVMAVAPFEQTCSGCHLDQIAGKERVSGPKGVAFLTLPGLDLPTMKKKNAAIGEWPDASEAELTPFMKVMISRNAQGRALLKTVDKLNLQDLSKASAAEIKAVTNLAWEIKRLFHSLIKGKASDVLGDLNIASGAKLSPALVADLTASIPRDVVVSAQQQWLPNLAAEMANRPDPNDQAQSGWDAVTTEQSLGEQEGGAEAAKAKPEGSDVKTYTTNAGPEDGSEPLPGDESGPIKGRVTLPSGTPRAIEAARTKEKEAQPEDDSEKDDAAKARPDRGKDARSGDEPGIKDDEAAAQPEGAAGEPDTTNAKADGGKSTDAGHEQPQGKAGEQTDDLLFPTEDELRAIKAGGKVAQPDGAAAKADTQSSAGNADAGKADANASADAPAGREAAAGSDTKAAAPQARVAPVISIESDVDPEAWAEYGGWYRQDYAIFYRPTGHKDKFIYSWLFLTGPQAPKGDTSPAAAVFDVLTSKDAQGSCTKCHSVDDIQGKGRVVNFSPPSVASKHGRFTNFIHEPHFGIMENRGCLTCHNLEKGTTYLSSFEQGNPKKFVSNFGDVKKDLCQTCHTSTMARQDCLTCHSYHVNGVVTPIISTKLPSQ